MNYLDAVKELVNNPKAEAITFPGRKETRRIVLDWKSGINTATGKRVEFANLVFPATETKRKMNVVATSPEFLLREDFTIEYKKENIYDRIAAASGVNRTDVKKVFLTANYMAQEESARQFFKDIKKIFGE